MNKQDIEIVRGDDETVILKLLGDFTSETAYFTIKEDREDLTGFRYVDLTTGSGIVATYDDTETTFTMTIPKANTSSLVFSEMDYDLVFDENKTKITGKVKIIHDVRTPTDGSVITHAVKYLLLKLEAGVTTEKRAFGFTGTLSYVFSGGSLTITSTYSGDFPSEIFILPSQTDCNYAYVSDSVITITPNVDYGVLMIKITKEV